MSVVAIISLANQILGLMPVGLDVALKLKGLVEVDGSEFTVRIETIRDGALATVAETERIIAEWKEGHP